MYSCNSKQDSGTRTFISIRRVFNFFNTVSGAIPYVIGWFFFGNFVFHFFWWLRLSLFIFFQSFAYIIRCLFNLSYRCCLKNVPYCILLFQAHLFTLIIELSTYKSNFFFVTAYNCSFYCTTWIFAYFFDHRSFGAFGTHKLTLFILSPLHSEICSTNRTLWS